MGQQFTITGKAGAWRLLSPVGEAVCWMPGQPLTFRRLSAAKAFCQAFEIPVVTRAEGE